MYKFQIYKYYSNENIKKIMVDLAKDREVVGTFLNGSYSKRPDILVYPRDVEEKVKEGIVAFHFSVEKWKDPMKLSSEMSEEQLRNLRKGWDVIIDIDAKSKLEHSKLAAEVIIDFLKDYGIKPTVKFSGRRGFHIAIAENALPRKVNFQDVRKLYPDLLKTIIEFIREQTKQKILEELIKFEGGVASLIKTVDSVSSLSPFEFLEIEKDWGPRHLFRAPFSLHQKTFLVSLPLKNLKKFKLEDAKPFLFDKKSFKVEFLKNKDLEASELVIAALEWKRKMKKEEKKVSEEIRPKISIKKIKTKIPEEFFPPCIKNILKGLSDGRKRSVFTLLTFLRNVGWNNEEIEERLKEWNRNNKPPLRENYIRTQLKWHFRQERELLPANCDSDMFYKDIGVCEPDKICEKIKNPVSYPFKIISLGKKTKKQKKRTKKKK